MDLNKVQWGWEKDPEDPRDFPAERLVFAALPLPASYYVWPDTPIYDQGSSPSCVGFSCAGVKSDEEYIQHAASYLFNGTWLYDECKKIDGIPNVSGTYLRFAMQILQKQGMRQSGSLCFKRRPDSFWQIRQYFRLANDSSDEFIKQVILQFGSIAVGSLWYRSWMDVSNVFPEPDVMTGGHAWRVCGWKPEGWHVVNSWGKTSWGNGGKATMPYDVFRRAVLDTGADVWKLVDK